MLRKLCFISLFACLVFSVTSTSHAASTIEIVDRDFQTVSISLQGRTLHVVGADGLTLNIYNVAGIRVMSFKVDGADRRFELNLPKGCYMVQAGKTVRKISITK
ncbi:MAG: T9SS type A sorting domain-containing protein [Bacteroidales bacterium]|nr:T9SS type A sorting domain-containing protein [Bacteroidales bacterium]MDY2692237.1 T9SS type A sorting domain-containing protein [Prevotella sp.]MDD5788862.1 T9SS type A sorting domain-containing protein [Bacteroidales bacterium]MDD6897053.1 T9SS type A sorting domain-containing protein [Bacteroidales bacterium]MDY4732637.1 T9SS type A sorting domain-containing protein [Prevotella sp.]